MITYQLEQYAQVKPEVDELLPDHYKEIATDQDVIPLDMDDATYRQMAADDELHIVTVRCDGKLIGYHCTLVKTHLHYQSTLCGFTDVYYLKPEYRRGQVGIGMFQYAEKTLRERGVVKLFTGTKTHFDVSPLFERMGWVRTETLFTKVINGRAETDHTSGGGGQRGC